MMTSVLMDDRRTLSNAGKRSRRRRRRMESIMGRVYLPFRAIRGPGGASYTPAGSKVKPPRPKMNLVHFSIAKHFCIGTMTATYAPLKS